MNEQEKKTVERLLATWLSAERAYIYERSCDFDRDLIELGEKYGKFRLELNLEEDTKWSDNW